MTRDELQRNIGKMMWICEDDEISHRGIKLLWKDQDIAVTTRDDLDYTTIFPFADIHPTRKEAVDRLLEKIKKRTDDLYRQIDNLRELAERIIKKYAE